MSDPDFHLTVTAAFDYVWTIGDHGEIEVSVTEAGQEDPSMPALTIGADLLMDALEEDLDDADADDVEDWIALAGHLRAMANMISTRLQEFYS